MDLAISAKIPELKVSPSVMFTYPTRTVNIWQPNSAMVILPEEHNLPVPVEIRVAPGIAISKSPKSRKRRVYEALQEGLAGRKIHETENTFIFDARFDNDRNLAHVLEIVARVLFVKTHLARQYQQNIDIHVILKSQPSKLALSIYSLLGIPTIHTEHDVKGLVISISLPGNLLERKPQLFSGFNPQLFPALVPDHDDIPVFERIFIPRKGRRCLINNDEVSAFLEKAGFKTLYFEDFTLQEQWSIAKNAKFVVAIHGAGVSNLVFNRIGLDHADKDNSGVKVVEIMSPSWIHFGFRDLVNAVNGKWCAVRGQITPNILRVIDFSQEIPHPSKSPFKDPFKAHIQSIEQALAYLSDNSVSENTQMDFEGIGIQL